MASSSLTGSERRNWAELPSELTFSILRRLGSIDILESAQKVCTSWHRFCKDPAMWRKIDMRNSRDSKFNLEIMCRHAVDRSQGGLVEIDIWVIGTDSLLNYIAERSSNLRCLRLAMCPPITTAGLTEVLGKLPFLEELELSFCLLSEKSLRAVGQSCPNLKTLKLNRLRLSDGPIVIDNDAVAIAETMPGLCFLQLFGSLLTNAGLDAILDNCPNLEHLDLRQCLNVGVVDGDLEKRCSGRIKVLRPPSNPRIYLAVDYDYCFEDSDEDDILGNIVSSISDDIGSDDLSFMFPSLSL